MKLDGNVIVFGADYEIADINLDDLIFLPQVRKKKNTSIDEIANSIENRYLINFPDVAKLDRQAFENHINFINQLWKKNININDYKPVDGHYYVVIAGHTRLEAMKMICKKHGKPGLVRVKLHNTKDSREILAIQLEENLHREVSVEERAIAIIESYRLGLADGEWHNKREFIEEISSRSLSRDMLDDALAFADLPSEVQEYIFSKNVPYAVGVELGRMYPLIEKYEVAYYGSDESLEGNIKIYYGKFLNELLQAKSIKSALVKISGEVKRLNDYFRPSNELQQEMLDLWEAGPEIQRENHRRQLLKDHDRAVRELNSMPFERVIELFSLDKSLTGVDHSLDIQHIKNFYYQYLNQQSPNPVDKK